MSKLRLTEHLMRALNWILFIMTALAVFGYYVDPRTTPLLALMGLGYPLLLLSNLLFIAYWAFKAKRQFWISLLAVVLSWGQLTTFYRIKTKTLVPDKETLDVMSFNVRMFNRYQWLEQDSVAANIKNLVDQAQPDILFIQEYYTYQETPSFNLPYSYIQATNDGKNYGLAIFSNYRIVRTGRVMYKSPGMTQNDEFIYADLVIGSDTVRAVNTHLASVKLDYRDYALLENPNAEPQEEVKKGLFTILERILHAFERRAHQVDILLQFMEETHLPVILAGDLNDTPSSRAYRRITHILEDAYVAAGSGFSSTYTRMPIPLRIDHLFFSQGFTIYDHEVLDEVKLSDHYPILVKCALP